MPLFDQKIAMYKYKTFNKEEISGNPELLMDFYGRHYEPDYVIALKNSAYVCCCLKDGAVIGACRLITDYRAHTFIVDLIVDKDHRKQGIGRRLMQDAIKCLQEVDTYFNGISTDPRLPWLKDFYESLGFISEENHFVLTYPKK